MRRWSSTGFSTYLRKGRAAALTSEIELKFNPYHDPRDGRFTFGPGRGVLPPRIRTTVAKRHSTNLHNAVANSAEATATLQPANFLRGPRLGGGSNSRAFNDPMTLELVFPGLQNAPGGSIIALADNMLDATGPSRETTTAMSLQQSQVLIQQIQTIDAAYRFQSLGFPTTLEGQAAQLNDLRMDLAVAFYRKRGELRPLQTQTLRFLQSRVDAAYDKAVLRYNSGRLQPTLSRNEAIGNDIDRSVRYELRQAFRGRGILEEADISVRVNRRAPNSTDASYTVPDSRVGRIAFDVTLERKTPGSKQIRGFFDSDFSPTAVVIVRPSQIGRGSTYIIKRKGP